MKVDAVIIGAELDGWVAATRLLERGHSVCVLATGEGSLHYAPGGLHVLGYANGDAAHHVAAPFQSMAQLDPRHPYRVAGEDRVRAALDWFAGSPIGVEFAKDDDRGDRNRLGLTPAGLRLPVMNALGDQATIEAIAGKSITVVALDGHRDFPWGLLAAELARHGERVEVLAMAPPGGRRDTMAIARALDRPDQRDAWFAELRRRVPDKTEVVLVPAVFGCDRSPEVVAAATALLACPVLEVPTLPPCLPGVRLSAHCRRLVQDCAGVVRAGVRVAGAAADGDRIKSVTDQNGREIETDAIVLATGGVLMGGLTVDSHGDVQEPILGLAVQQTLPLSQDNAEATVDALHRAGVETDNVFRPRQKGSRAWQNVFVTGRNIANWNPGAEISAEGVSITSGWLAAEATHEGLAP